MRRLKNATGNEELPVTQTFFQKHQDAIMITGLIVIAGLLFIPDVYLRKYVPWVK